MWHSLWRSHFSTCFSSHSTYLLWTMQCPHSILKHGWKEGVAATVEKYRIGAKTCSACDFLLRVVEEYLPGWIYGSNKESNHAGNLRIIELCFWITHKFWCPPLVILRQVPQVGNATEKRSEEDQLPDGWDENAYNFGSFCCFRLPQSKFSIRYHEYLWTNCWSEGYLDKASFTDVYSPIFDTEIVIRESLDIVEDSSSTMAFDRVARWLSHCLKNDDECRIPTPNYMPRGLLNVGSDQGCHPFLFEPTRAEPYVCLSYCWGADVYDVLKTTKENLQSHYKAIPLPAFPQTIRDVVLVCRVMNLQYLWVDSICIVQDDPTGWLHDSAQMRDITWIHTSPYLHKNQHLARKASWDLKSLDNENGSGNSSFLCLQMLVDQETRSLLCR